MHFFAIFFFFKANGKVVPSLSGPRYCMKKTPETLQHQINSSKLLDGLDFPLG